MIAVKRFFISCFASLTVCTSAGACASALKTIDEVNNPADDVKLSKCRAVGRAAKEAGAEPDAAYGAYEACKKEAGL
jgi:hypothetical protein